jgi:hypothetical protein
MSHVDELEQRVIIKIFWLQEQGSELIHVHLRVTFGARVVSIPTVKRSPRRFESWGMCYPSAKKITRHFDMSASSNDSDNSGRAPGCLHKLDSKVKLGR